MTEENILLVDKDAVLDEPIIYEVIRVINKKPLFLEDHLVRMATSLEYYSEVKLDFDLIKEKINNTITKNKMVNQNFRIELGSITLNALHYKIFPVNSFYLNKRIYNEGVNTISVLKNRKNPLIKSMDLSFKDYISNLLKENDAYEAILKDENDKLHEGSRSNLFFVKENKVITSKKGDALEGITLKNIIEVINDSPYIFERKDVFISDLKTIDGVFITGTSIDILPVKKIDAIKYESAKNPVILDLIDKFKQLKLKNIGGM